MASAPARQTETIIGSISGVQANGHSHREEEGSLPIVFGKPIDEEDQGHHDRA